MDYNTVSNLLPDWLKMTLSYCGAFAVIISTIYLVSKFLRSILNTSILISKINALIPVLFTMASQFQTDNGSSLHESIEKLNIQMAAQGKLISDSLISKTELKETMEETNRKISEQGDLIRSVEEHSKAAFSLAQEASELARFVAAEIPSKVEICNRDPIPVCEKSEEVQSTKVN